MFRRVMFRRIMVRRRRRCFNELGVLAAPPPIGSVLEFPTRMIDSSAPIRLGWNRPFRIAATWHRDGGAFARPTMNWTW